jgi:hypothetical protein
MAPAIHTNGVHHEADEAIDSLYAWMPPSPPAQALPEAAFSLTLKGRFGRAGSPADRPGPDGRGLQGEPPGDPWAARSAGPATGATGSQPGPGLVCQTWYTAAIPHLSYVIE